MPPKGKPNTDAEDSASTSTPANKGPDSSESKGGKNSSGRNNAPKGGTNPSPRNPPPKGFPEGNKTLESYGLSLSGRKERILSLFKTEKFFHLVEDSWSQLVDSKPHITERFSLAEFRHCAALQLFNRIEQVKFDALGTKPGATTRIPLPRNLRVFLPIWSVLSNIGIVNDDELRVTYIPDASLPKTPDLSDPEDAINIVSCTLYDWQWSWEQVQDARNSRDDYDTRIGATPMVESNEAPLSQDELITAIADARRAWNQARRAEGSAQYRIVNGHLYRVPPRPDDHQGDWNPPDNLVSTGEQFPTAATTRAALDGLIQQARRTKEQMIRPRLDRTYNIQDYQLADGTIDASPGAYGQWLHWDPQLWIEYEQTVEILAGTAMFSLSMPVETDGTYMWLIPVEAREDSADVFCKLPKASIPPVTWILSMLIQSSTLPLLSRSTWYAETDRLANVVGLRNRFIRAAIKKAAPVEQYGTY